MASKKVIRSLIALAALSISASAVPMMPLSLGLMGGLGGMMGGHGGMGRGGPHIGASYSQQANNNGGMMTAPMKSPTVLNGVERFFSQQDDSLVQGVSVIIKSSDSSDSMGPMGHHGGMGMGHPWMAGGLAGGLNLWSTGLYTGGLNPAGLLGGYGVPGGHHSQGDDIEAVIEVLKPANFPTTPALVVFTEPAVTSASADCPRGPVLTRPLRSNSHQGFDGFGFAGAHSMLGGFGAPHMGMGMGNMEPDFGVIAEVTLQPGVNTFNLRGLGPFTKIHQLAGHGMSICKNVQIGIDGRSGCMGDVLGCVKLGFASEPERLMMPVE